MSRSTDEWIAKHDDQKVPDRVKVRVFEREGGICHLTGAKIDPVRDEWDLDHKMALILGGQHRESNLFPALRGPHRKKTAVEMGVKSKIARVKKKHMGLRKTEGRGFSQRLRQRMDGTVYDKQTGEIIREGRR
ncbi:HNH endonuclease [Neorhizobium vignae]|uniref:HNH endonuclease n=1 Tax=Neorhizobium vignae TaxID=690585 RepID=UPI00056216F3|nr:HNH endonuclease [Neorhizobium vignae]